MGDFAKLVPTTRLRFVEKAIQIAPAEPETNTRAMSKMARVLQQFWAEDMPGYMRDQAKGEWRDVALESESGG
jgi:hypothetical protein